MRPSSWRRRAALVTAASIALVVPIAAQNTTAGTPGMLGPAEIHDVRNAPDVPQPPGAVSATPELPGHRLPPVPEGPVNGMPQPQSPPIAGVTGGSGPGAPCDVDYFVNRPVTPGGAARATVCEPSVACNNDTVLHTGNWYAALSRDSGQSWQYVNPATTFPSVDGGFCCDQRAIYVPAHDMTVWYLQYSYSATTQRGSVRIAISPSRNALASGAWHSWVFSPANFGFGAGHWLDFPDVAYGNAHLYCASNLFDAAGNYVNSIVWRMQLPDLDDAGTVAFRTWTRSAASPIGGGASYRFAQGGTGTVYFASHNSTSSIRLFRAVETSTSLAWNDRAVSSWSGGSFVAIAPNGTNWAARSDSRIQSGYSTSTEYGFMWNVGRRPANGRPQPYVRVIRARVSDNVVFDQQDLFNSTWAFLYPALAVNALGEPAYTCAVGTADGATNGLHPTNFFRIVNVASCLHNFSGGSISVPFQGTHSPSQPLWGDYFTVQRHPTYPNTFVGTGMTQVGGSANGNQQPRYVWFGRESQTPNLAAVTVRHNILPVPTIPITSTYTDITGAKDASTPFTHQYPNFGRYEFTAPAQVTGAGNTYVFRHWRYRTTTSGTWIDQPDGQRTLSIENIGNSDDEAEPIYILETTFTIDDRNVGGGVPITVGTTDLDGNKNGVTRFTRRYEFSLSGYTFTAPATFGTRPFRRWYVGGVAMPIGQLTVTAGPIASAVTLEAEYCSHTIGVYMLYGDGCVGSNGFTPVHFSASDPEIGTTVDHRVTLFFGSTSAAMFLGFSKTLWNGLPLPLSLGFIGADPSCSILAEGFAILPMTTSAAGNGGKNVTIPNNPSLIGMHVYTQVVGIDPFVSAPLKLVTSNGLDMLVGGSSLGGLRCP